MSDLDCREFVEQVTAFLEGALDAEAERRFVEHLGPCDGCDRYLDQIRRTVASLGGLPAEGLPADTRAALLDAFRGRRG
ncbi:MAG TPA: zf-HC2 domain-containing protein [Kribbella sp.]|nr:zf-HC2 domain-containing protein [Kribbella sp.]